MVGTIGSAVNPLPVFLHSRLKTFPMVSDPPSSALIPRITKTCAKGLICGLFLGLFVSGSVHAARLDVTEEENGKDLLLNRGDLLVVHLPANRTMGYGWQPTTLPKGVLRAEGEAFYLVSKNQGHLVGAGGTETWIFRAEKKGSTTLSLGYVRPWEKGKAPEKTVAWPVTVRP
jgi:inhibitor of cysteine peptidase